MYGLLMAVSAGAGAVAPATIGTAIEGANGTTVVSDPFTLAPGQCLAAAVASFRADGDSVPTSVVWSLGGGESLTMTDDAPLATNTRRVSGWTKADATPGTGTLTATWAQTQNAPVILPLSLTRVDTATPFDSGTIDRVDEGAGTGPGDTDVVSQENDLVLTFAALALNRTFTPTSGAIVSAQSTTNWGIHIYSKTGEASAETAGSYDEDTFGFGWVSVNFNRAGSVAPSVLTSFGVVGSPGGGDIGAQLVNVSGNILLRALDQYGNVLTSFTGTVDLTSTGSLSAGGGTTAAFVAGLLTHAVTFDATDAGIVIDVADTDTGLITGQSNAFDVVTSGLTLVETRTYTATTKAGWFDAVGNWALSGDAQDCICTFPAGMPFGISPHDEAFAIPTPKRACRIEIAFTLAADFQGNPITNKLGFMYPNDLGLVYVDLNGVDLGPYSLNINVQGTVVPGNANYSPNIVPGATINPGTAYTLRFDVLGNTSATANGETQLWSSTDDVNFTLVNQRTGIQYTAGSALITQWASSFTWGGGSGTISSPFIMTYRNIRVYTGDTL